MRRRWWRIAAPCADLILLAGCAVGPRYHRPVPITPDNFKETVGWKFAQPTDAAIRGPWWELFDDPQLNAFEEQVSVSNQTIAASAAGFLAARALVKQARSQLYPTVTANPSITVSRGSISRVQTTSPSSGSVVTSGSTGSVLTPASSTSTVTDYSLPFDASYEPDLWGRVGSTVRMNAAAAQVSAADLENTRLTIQAELAVDYFQLRGQDWLKQVLDSTVAAFQEALDLAKARYETGIDSDESVAQAETQLESAQAQDTNLGILRAQYEHAIAMLLGQPASTFSMPLQPLTANPPAIPIGVPSQLLERRPDVAAAERSAAEANAQIGVAKAAFFPTLTLSGSLGFASTSLANWLTWPSRVWSVGPALAATLFDGGLRKATAAQYEAAYRPDGGELSRDRARRVSAGRRQPLHSPNPDGRSSAAGYCSELSGTKSPARHRQVQIRDRSVT